MKVEGGGRVDSEDMIEVRRSWVYSYLLFYNIPK